MLPTVFASYKDRGAAERLLGALLDAGVAPEDLSAVVKSNGETGTKEINESLLEVESGETATPMLGHVGLQSEGSYIYESQIGGGISTENANDDVSGVEEMDDSEEIAEEMAYPDTESSFSAEDDPMIEHAAETGFYGLTDTGVEGLGLEKKQWGISLGDTLSFVAMPHFGLVLGDGALATAVMSAGVAAQVGGTPAAELQDYLEDQAVPRDIAFLLSADFEEGGAVVAVAAPPGGIDSDALQRVLEDNGARNVQIIEAVD